MNNTDVSFFFLLLGRFLSLRNYCWKVLLTLLKSRVPFHRCLIFKVQLSCLFRNSSPILSHYSLSCQGFSLTFLKFFRDRFRLFSLSPLGNSVVILSPIFPVVNPFSPFFWPFLRFCTPSRVCLWDLVVLGTICSITPKIIHHFPISWNQYVSRI